jgi:hypothetical protein
MNPMPKSKKPLLQNGSGYERPCLMTASKVLWLRSIFAAQGGKQPLEVILYRVQFMLRRYLGSGGKMCL